MTTPFEKELFELIKKYDIIELPIINKEEKRIDFKTLKDWNLEICGNELGIRGIVKKEKIK